MAQALAEGRTVCSVASRCAVPLDRLPVALQTNPDRWRRHLM